MCVLFIVVAAVNVVVMRLMFVVAAGCGLWSSHGLHSCLMLLFVDRELVKERTPKSLSLNKRNKKADVFLSTSKKGGLFSYE